MAITLISGLDVNPDRTNLPRRIDLRMILRSTRSAGENAVFTYTLAQTHDVWFESGGGLTKKIERRTFVPFVMTDTFHRIRVRWDHASSAQNLDVPIMVKVQSVATRPAGPVTSADTLFVRLP